MGGNRGKNILYVVKEDGSLVISPRPRAGEWGHVDLAGGQPVLAAGEGKYWAGQFKMLDNASGHYLPEGISAQNAALDAFQNAGYTVRDGAYIEKMWDAQLGRWVQK
jgi:hypothetical protein